MWDCCVSYARRLERLLPQPAEGDLAGRDIHAAIEPGVAGPHLVLSEGRFRDRSKRMCILEGRAAVDLLGGFVRAVPIDRVDAHVVLILDHHKISAHCCLRPMPRSSALPAPCRSAAF